MVAVFAVFLIALLAVFLRPEGRADRFAHVTSFISSAQETGRGLLRSGTEVVDRLSDDLAADQTQAGGLDGLLGPAESAPIAPTAD
jgi:hypothetical protein